MAPGPLDQALVAHRLTPRPSSAMAAHRSLLPRQLIRPQGPSAAQITRTRDGPLVRQSRRTIRPMRMRIPSSPRRHPPGPRRAADGSAEGGGDAAVRLPDLLRQAVELGQVFLAVCDLLPPPAEVDGEQPLEISGCDVAALEVELL